MSVADFAHLLKVSCDRGNAARRRPAHRLGNECDDRLGAQLCDLRLELPGEALTVAAGCLVGLPAAIFAAGRDVVRVDQQRCELLAAPGVAANGERSQGIAVVALSASDEVAALRFADLDEILARQLEGRLDGFRAAITK